MHCTALKSILTIDARQDPTAPGVPAMLGRFFRHWVSMSLSQSEVRMAPGWWEGNIHLNFEGAHGEMECPHIIHTSQAKKAICTARPSSFWHPDPSWSYCRIMHLYTKP